MRIERRYTKAGRSPYADIAFRKATSEIRNPDGSVVFRLEGIDVPEHFSQVATDIIAQKYFRKAGVPARLKKVEEETIPSFLWRGAADEKALGALAEKERFVGETDSRQVFDRLAGTWTYWGWKGGYFDSEEDAQAFFDEHRYMLAMQMAAPNSPQWFNTGLHWAYGIDGPGQGHFYVDYATGKLTRSKSSYEHPQPHACFIQSVSDDLVNEGGIMDLWVREARLFKYGSGTGSNFSALRGEGEKLSGGGRSSGLMSFLKIGDRAAGAIKSGGTTRRAAKMVVVDADHPDIETYVDWKVKEEQKVAALVTGSKTVAKHMKAVMKACVNCEGEDDDCFEPEKNPALKREIRAAKKAQVPENYVRRVIQFARQGYTDIEFPIYDTDWDSEAYLTVSGQNSNNSVRVDDAFLTAVEADGEWNLVSRTTGKVTKTLKAKELWEKIGYAAWACADPGIQFHTTINDWHTSPAGGDIRASNPCSEYMFLDDTACNLASLNLLQFRKADGSFDVESYEHACRLWTVVLEISILMAQFPSKEIAKLSYEYRTLGLGYANIGGLLMTSGIPYDSDEGRAYCGALTAIMTGVAYATSAEMAKELGPFPEYKPNATHMLRVMRNHRRAAYGEKGSYEGLNTNPVPLDHAKVPQPILVERAKANWDQALALGEEHGYRNAQTTLLAPTGTIGLVMDCDTTGIEPDLALKKFKKLVGGGSMEIVNHTVPRALRKLGYQPEQVEAIVEYIAEHGHIVDAPGLKREHYEVFDCAMGERSISPMGHVRMMAAAQPFLSGAISKTVNMPESATIEDIEKVYFEGWKMGLKALAIYRDNCKVGQPLSAAKKKEEVKEAPAAAAAPVPAAPVRPVRRRLPKKRPATVTRFSVAGAEGYMTASSYPDNGLGEVFLKLGKQGSTLAGVMDAFSMAISISLQYGVPLETWVEKFTNMRFEPAGMTDDPDIRMATSFMDYIFRRLALDHLPYESRAALGIFSAEERTLQAAGEDPASLHTEEAETVEALAQSAEIERHAEPLPVLATAPARVDATESHGRRTADAPMCMTCGTSMRPAGSCYVCEGCGSTSGCS